MTFSRWNPDYGEGNKEWHYQEGGYSSCHAQLRAQEDTITGYNHIMAHYGTETAGALFHVYKHRNSSGPCLIQPAVQGAGDCIVPNTNKINQISKINSRSKKMFLVIMFIIVAAAITCL
eukprot:39547_1